MKSLGFVHAFLAAILWGLVYALDQKILTKISPAQLLFFHSVLGTAILLPFVLRNSGAIQEFMQLDRSIVLLMLLTHIVSLAANMFILSAVQRLGASTASVFEIAYPFFVVLFSVVLYGSRINGYFILGAALLFVGSWIIITHG